MKKTKKGFTLVELLVVIAIVAILATVSVVGYLSFTNKAKQSADETAVTQMNTVLQATDVNNKVDDIVEVFTILGEQGLNAKNYQPLTSNTAFYWHKGENKVVILDVTTKQIIYPESLKNSNYGLGNLFALNGIVEKDPTFVKTTDNSGKVNSTTVTTGNQFLAVVEDIEKNPTAYSETVDINVSTDIDLMGSNESGLDLSKITNLKNINIIGTPVTKAVKGTKRSALNTNPTISGIVNVKNQYVSPDHNGTNWDYSTGIIGLVQNQNVTIKNINFNNITSHRDGNALGVGGIIGEVKGNSNVVFENVHITNANIFGAQFVGGFIGRVLYDPGNNLSDTGNVSLTFKDCSISNSKIGALFGHNAGLVGAINELCNFTKEEKANPNLALDRIKRNITISNTVVADNVDLYVSGVEKIDYTLSSTVVMEHTNYVNEGNTKESISTYKLLKDKLMSGGLYNVKDNIVDFYWLFTSAKLFNMNPTFRHDTGSSDGQPLIQYNGKKLRFSNALIQFDTLDDLNNIKLLELEKALTA